MKRLTAELKVVRRSGEWVMEYYGTNGYDEGKTYYTDDKADAKAVMVNTIERLGEEGYVISWQTDDIVAMHKEL